MTHVLKVHPHLLEKRTDYLVQTARQKVSSGEFHVLIGMFPNVQNSKFQVDANSETTRVCKHTAKSADEKNNSASIAIHIPSSDHRQMRLRKIQSDAKTNTE